MRKRNTTQRIKNLRRQITRSRTNRALLNRQRAFFLQTFAEELEHSEHAES